MAWRIVLIASIALISAGVWAQRPERNAFLDHRCSSTAALVTEARNNPEVMDRFCRHFAMGHDDMLRYLGSLHVSHLARSGVYTVYSVPAPGYVKAHAERIAKGTLIFADMNEAPILLEKCGNPLTLGPSQPVEVAAVPIVTPAPPVREEVVVGEVTPAPPIMPAPAPEVPVLVASAPPPVAVAQVGGAGFTAWPLLFVPLLFVHGGHGCSCSSGCNCQPVPEPASFLAFGIGAAALIARKKFGKR